MQSGRLIQSTYGNPGNFEALVLEGHQIVHYWRDNSNGDIWHKGDVVSSHATGDASLIQSSYVGTPGAPANFEAVILEGNELVHYWRDNSNGNKWNRQDVITSKATASGALIQSTYKGEIGAPGNFEVVVLEGSDLVHYWRDNAHGNKWNRQDVITSKASSPGALIQSTYKSNPGAPGNFEVVVCEGKDLVHYWRDNSNGNVWHRQEIIACTKTNGPGTLIQSSYGNPGNFELMVLECPHLVHYWRDNSNGNTWHRQVIITTTADGPGSLIQSTYGTPWNPGNLELIVVQDGHNLDHYWRNDSASGNPWSFTVTISTRASG